jgi:hypothetical protein
MEDGCEVVPPGLTSRILRYRFGKCESQSTRLTQLATVGVSPQELFMYQLMAISCRPSYVPGVAPTESCVVVIPCGKLRQVALSPLSNRKPPLKPGSARVAGSVILARVWFASSITWATVRRTRPSRAGSAAISRWWMP